MYYPNFSNISLDNPNKILFSIYASAVLMQLFKKQRDAVGLTTYSNEIDDHIISKTSDRHHQIIYKKFEDILSINAKESQRKSSTISSLHEIADRINQRSLIVLFTDLIDNSSLDDVFDAFRHLNTKKMKLYYFIYQMSQKKNI